jgi:hypothetical protein
VLLMCSNWRTAISAEPETLYCDRFLLGLRFSLLCSPALALRVCNALTRFHAQHALLLFCFGGGFWCFALGCSRCSKAGQQCARLCEPCDFRIDLGEDTFYSHIEKDSRITLLLHRKEDSFRTYRIFLDQVTFWHIFAVMQYPKLDTGRDKWLRAAINAAI